MTTPKPEATMPAIAEAPDFRVGHRVPRNIYWGDEGITMVATAELAAKLVMLLNLGLAALRADPTAGIDSHAP